MDKKRYMLSQYANSPHLSEILDGLEKMIGTDQDIKNFYDNIYNIQTANTYGLNVWGGRLNIPRRLKVSAEGMPDLYELPDELYRLLLIVKTMANISNCTVPDLERILNFLFSERGKVYVFDTGIMTMSYTFEFYLNPYEKALLKIPGIPPKPTGVGLKIYQVPPDDTFGFYGSGYQPFNQGVFWDGGYNGED